MYSWLCQFPWCLVIWWRNLCQDKTLQPLDSLMTFSKVMHTDCTVHQCKTDAQPKCRPFCQVFLSWPVVSYLDLTHFCAAEWFPSFSMDAFMLPMEWTYHYTKCTFFWLLENMSKQKLVLKQTAFPWRESALSFPVCWTEHSFATLDRLLMDEHNVCYFPDLPYLFSS